MHPRYLIFADVFESSPVRRCSIWDPHYNQVHVSFNISLVRAIFYVNDTFTSTRLPMFNHSLSDRVDRGASLETHRNRSEARLAWQRLKQKLNAGALQAAADAFSVARAAQLLVAQEYNVNLPVVQYVFTADCFRPERLALRLRLTKARNSTVLLNATRGVKGDAVWIAETAFSVPPWG